MSKFTRPVLDRNFDEIVRLLIDEFDPELMKDNTAVHNIFTFHVVGTEIEVRFEVGNFKIIKSYEKDDSLEGNKDKPDFVFLILQKHRLRILGEEKELIMRCCKDCAVKMREASGRIHILEEQDKTRADLWNDNCTKCNNKLEENMPEIDKKMRTYLSNQIRDGLNRTDSDVSISRLGLINQKIERISNK